MSTRPPRTTRIAPDVIRTTVYGRATIAAVDMWSADFERLCGARFWLFDGMEATGYDTAAINPSVRRSTGLAERRMFDVIVVATANSFAKLGANVVRMTSKVAIEIFGTMDEADAFMAQRRAAGTWRRSGAWRL